MEPIDFDSIIKDKLQGSDDLHAHEMESAKPFVWSAVQNQLGSKRSLRWYHLAAAVVLLFVSFSIVLFDVQKGYEMEIEMLAKRIDQLQVKYLSQEELLHTKSTQVDELGDELKNVEFQLADLSHLGPTIQKETIIYQTDTVYLKQVEYITMVPDPKEEEVTDTTSGKGQPVLMDIVAMKETETDDVIFPSYAKQTESTQPETIKLKFGSFAVRKN